MQNRLSRYLEGRFLKLSAYFFVMRIILLNFAEKITGMEKTVLLEPGLKISEVEDKIFIKGIIQISFLTVMLLN